ncbi:DUF817 domain-containing protein [Deinococcus sp.]|uniref:DUF817 domain-containing protein n=1 Tax=Deinococcus sp. TaxID=47478 RepID=UPI0025BFBD4D|nr:DUF817 domain-containing protein [Deinococcus sp.]
MTRDLLDFVKLEAQSCTLAFIVVALLGLSRVLPLNNWGLARYDFLLLGCVLAQLMLIAARFESWREAGVILAFHVLGFALEVFKVAHGSWAYPEDALSKVLGMPLYAGFMYASVGSYMAQAWKRCRLSLHHAPPLALQAALAGTAYLNFFTHHYGPDLRSVICLALLGAFWRTRASFVAGERTWNMPLPLAFVLIGGFVFLAENAATGLGAWVYPQQAAGWHPVHLGKLLSWTLMVVVAFLIVSSVHAWEARQKRQALGFRKQR